MNILLSMSLIMITKSAFYRLIYNMKKILFLFFSMLSMTVAAASGLVPFASRKPQYPKGAIIVAEC